MQLFMRRPNLDDLPELPVLPGGYLLREYQEGDETPLADLLALTFEDASWTPEKVRSTFIDAPDVEKMMVIAYRGVPIATASARLLPKLYPNSGYVHYVAADPEHKGQRLGYIVTLAALHEFLGLGCQDAVLETDDFRSPAIKTYLHLGFAPEHRHETHPQRWAAIHQRLFGTQ